MSSIGVGFILIVLGLLGTLAWLIALIDALRRPTGAWESAGQNQLVWVLVIVLANFIGAVLYWIIARPQLQKN